MVRVTGKKAIIIAHSFGGVVCHKFLTTYVTAEWKARHIKALITLGTPFGGSVETVKVRS